MKTSKNTPLTISAKFLVDFYVFPTISKFKDKEFDEDVRGVLVTAYFALELYTMTAQKTLSHKQYIETLDSSQFLNVKSFEDLFGMPAAKQKSLRSKLRDPLPYVQIGDNSMILYDRDIVGKWLENYKKA